jgi:protein O-mannosyl-transferase
MSKQKPQKYKPKQKASTKKQEDIALKKQNKKRKIYPILLVIITLLVYSSSLKNGFIYNWDDSGYILKNEVIHEITAENVNTIFTSFYFHNYHPLTTITYAIEYAIVGESPFLYHFNNLILHLLNTLLVFWMILLIKPKKYDWAGIVALLFAIHPMHVESVAWISERKDVLYAFFYLGSIISYLYYKTKGKKLKYYIYSIVFFLLSCLSKSMAVTLPLVLILLDFYLEKDSLSFKLFIKKIWKFGTQKTVFFIISIGFGVAAVYSQDTAIQNLAPILSPYERISILSYTFLLYSIKVFAPIQLSAMYPYPLKMGGLLPLKYLIAPLGVILLIVLLFVFRKKIKNIIWGILFFLLSISIVIQFVPVGGVILSERYTYLPYIGFFFLIAAFYDKIRFDTKFVLYKSRKFFVALLLVVLSWFAYATYDRVSYWEDGDLLFTNVIEQYPNLSFAYSNRGFLYFDHYAMNTFKEVNQQQFNIYMDKALADYNHAIALDSTFVDAVVNRGVLLYNYGQVINNPEMYKASLKDFNSVLNMEANNKDALLGRANTLSTLGQYEKALPDYNVYILLFENPERSTGEWEEKAYLWRGTAYYKIGEFDKALFDFEVSAKLLPEYWESYYWTGLVYQQKEDFNAAINYFNQSIRMYPEHSESYSWRGLAKYNIKDYQGAIQDYTKAIQYNPNDVAAYVNRSLTYNELGMYNEAIKDLDVLLQSGYPLNEDYYKSVLERVK